MVKLTDSDLKTCVCRYLAVRILNYIVKEVPVLLYLSVFMLLYQMRPLMVLLSSGDLSKLQKKNTNFIPILKDISKVYPCHP